MTLRERIADWISGGALSRTGWALAVNQKLAKTYIDLHGENLKTLRAIIERGNTASPNGTVKAMQAIAREALGE